ncbi:uncharacterized protein LOC143535342 [Bidens hawaiensis]|uniref:uncharacterized protein LOC143535342 n=1 Tax=Bidens hawaiensis TaxID=980011 RepID=UPI00404AF8CC
MEVQTIPPSPAAEFNFDSTATSPYATAPSSPHQSTMIPFFWEHKPGIPKHDTDFAFGHLERHSISAADELFDCGIIKPLKPPPCMHFPSDSPGSCKPPSFRFKEVLSGFDPFYEALKHTPNPPEENATNYGRETMTKSNKYNKWNIKNLLLFRSVSEGGVTTRKVTLNKYAMLKKDEAFSFRSTDIGSMMVSVEEVNLTTVGETRRKANLPCKSGLLGCLRFHQNARSVIKQ